MRPPPRSTLFPYTTLFRSERARAHDLARHREAIAVDHADLDGDDRLVVLHEGREDRKSTRLNSSHMSISYAVFCLKKKINYVNRDCQTIGSGRSLQRVDSS